MTSPWDSRKGDLIAAITLCTALSTLSFIGRLWGRWLSALRLGWDDAFMASAVLGCWAISADNIVALYYGSGRHVRYLSSSDIRKWTITFYAFIFLQVFTTTVLKLAILGLYRRTFVTKAFQRAIFIVTVFILADSLGLLLAECLYCIPAEHLWNPKVPGKCINRVVYTTLASCTLLVTDLVLYLMPLPVIWKLQMTMRRKLELTFIFMLGGFICITRVIQIVDTSRLDFEDVTWSNVNVAIWNMIEVHIGCVTANIPLMGPLFTRFGNLMHRFGLFGHKRNSETGGTGSSHSLAKHTLKGRIGVEHEFQRIDDFRFGPEKEGRTMTPTIGKGEAHSDDEFELASLGAQGIMVRRDLEQNSYMKPATQ